MYSFTARACAAEELTDLEAYVVAIYDDPQSPSYGLELQKPLVVDQQDRDLGLDTYCIAMIDGRTHYGGIKTVQLQGKRLSIAIDQQAADALGEDGVDVLLDVPDDQIDAVVAGLTTVFKDDPRAPTVSINR
jgi:hypothetical protein